MAHSWIRGEKMRIEKVPEGVPRDAVTKLLKTAEKSVLISTSLTPKFYNDSEVRPAFIDCIDKIKELHLLPMQVLIGNNERKSCLG